MINPDMAPRLYYSAFMLLAAGAFLLTQHLQRFLDSRGVDEALPRRQKLALMLAAFIGGAFGAKLPFLVMGEAGWTVWPADGKTITTALAGAYLTVEATKWWLGIRAKTGDRFALPLAVALAVGRWGCFFYGCCHGAPTELPWGCDFFGDGPRHPTQIYESLFHAAMAVVLIVVIRAAALRYQRLKLYLIAYCGYRFLSEFVRPEPLWALGLTFYQWTALAMAVPLSVQWIVDARQSRRGEAARPAN